ncbi:MAG TPA: polysaccharide export protein EpsE [Burkholderiales bacterium]|nr:polysaccharide export protein EpsE [Burkholderiales bacterium]
MRTSAILGCAAAVIALLLGCRIAAAAGDDAAEILGPGDMVRVTVFQNPDMTTEARLSARGAISFPLVGEIKIGGLTPSGAEARIADALKQGNFILNPQVNLTVLELRSRQVSVLGEVIKPGKYPLDDFNSKLSDILAMAGGINQNGADKVTLMISRNGKTEKIDVDFPEMFRSGDLSKNIEMHSGDIIFIQRAPVFYIYGEVQRPGSYRLEANMTVMQGLASGGGITPRGTEHGLRINRMVEGNIQSIRAKLDDIIQANDVIYIREGLF